MGKNILLENLAPAFDTSVAYTKGTFVTIGGYLYVAKRNMSAGEFKESNFAKIYLSDLLRGYVTPANVASGDVKKVELGRTTTAKTYDMKTLYPKTWQGLTADNFSIKDLNSTWVDAISTGSNGYEVYVSPPTMSKFSYNAVSGILTVTPGNTYINLTWPDGGNGGSGTFPFNVAVYIHYCE